MNMIESEVKREKTLQEFREELKIKGVDRNLYEASFLKIWNHVYKYRPTDIKANINRLKNLTFLVIRDHKYVYMELLDNNPKTVLMSITIMDGEFDEGGIFNLTLDDALEKFNELWKKKI